MAFFWACCAPSAAGQVEPEELQPVIATGRNGAEYPNLLPRREDEVDAKSPAAGVRIAADPPETFVYPEAGAGSQQPAAVPEPEGEAAAAAGVADDNGAEHDGRRVSFTSPVHDDADDPRSPSALARIRGRKPTAVVTKAEMAAALEGDSDDEDEDDGEGETAAAKAKAAPKKAPAAATAGHTASAMERLGLWKGRAQKRRGTGFMSKSKLEKTLAMYGEEAP